MSPTCLTADLSVEVRSAGINRLAVPLVKLTTVAKLPTGLSRLSAHGHKTICHVTSAESLSTFRQRLKTHLLPNLFPDYSLNWASPNLSLADLAVVFITWATLKIPD